MSESTKKSTKSKTTTGGESDDHRRRRSLGLITVERQDPESGSPARWTPIDGQPEFKTSASAEAWILEQAAKDVSLVGVTFRIIRVVNPSFCVHQRVTLVAESRPSPTASHDGGRE